jgi:hypothetical protein
MRLEGIDLLPTLEGRAPVVERTLFWRVMGARPQQAVRSGDWKLVWDGRPMLFNLRADIGERTDLLAGEPEVARQLQRLLVAWQQDVGKEKQ